MAPIPLQKIHWRSVQVKVWARLSVVHGSGQHSLSRNMQGLAAFKHKDMLRDMLVLVWEAMSLQITLAGFHRRQLGRQYRHIQQRADQVLPKDSNDMHCQADYIV